MDILWLCQYIAIENGPVEIASVPMKNGDFNHSYVNVYQRLVGKSVGVTSNL